MISFIALLLDHLEPLSPSQLLESPIKESKKSHPNDELHIGTNHSKSNFSIKVCEKELPSLIGSANISSKMISADSYLPHSTSTASATSITNHHHHSNRHPISIPTTTLNLSTMTAGSSNTSDSLPPPPPSYSRLPPDGHEFPPDYKDPSSTTVSSAVFRVCILQTSSY